MQTKKVSKIACCPVEKVWFRWKSLQWNNIYKYDGLGFRAKYEGLERKEKKCWQDHHKNSDLENSGTAITTKKKFENVLKIPNRDDQEELSTKSE